MKKTRRLSSLLLIILIAGMMGLSACGSGGGGGGGGEPALASTKCLDSINQIYIKNNVIEANNTCVDEAESYAGVESNDAYKARFFAALTGIFAPWFYMESDGDPDNGLNTFGDILDAIGCDKDGRDPIDPTFDCPENPSPDDLPGGAEIQTFTNTVIRQEIESTLGYLDQISDSFNVSWVDPFKGDNTESDYGDVLVMKALLKYILATIIIENSYNVDGINDMADEDMTIEQFLIDNPYFLTLSDPSELQYAKNLLGQSYDDINSAIDWMRSELDGQANDFIAFGDATETELDETKDDISKLKDALSSPVPLPDEEDPGQIFGYLDMGLFFYGTDIRLLMPEFIGNIPGYFPDPSFNGIWTGFQPGAEGDPNFDADFNGVPDILEN